jgi:hypothetical protein
LTMLFLSTISFSIFTSWKHLFFLKLYVLKMLFWRARMLFWRAELKTNKWALNCLSKIRRQTFWHKLWRT